MHERQVESVLAAQEEYEGGRCHEEKEAPPWTGEAGITLLRLWRDVIGRPVGVSRDDLEQSLGGLKYFVESILDHSFPYGHTVDHIFICRYAHIVIEKVHIKIEIFISFLIPCYEVRAGRKIPRAP